MVVEEAELVDVQPVRAAGVEMAARVEVALSDDVRAGQTIDGLWSGEGEEDVVVPGVLVRVHENHDVWKVGVVVNYVGEVDHCFVAFVGGKGVASLWLINGVYGCLDAG